MLCSFFYAISTNQICCLCSQHCETLWKYVVVRNAKQDPSHVLFLRTAQDEVFLEHFFISISALLAKSHHHQLPQVSSLEAYSPKEVGPSDRITPRDLAISVCFCCCCFSNEIVYYACIDRYRMLLETMFCFWLSQCH